MGRPARAAVRGCFRRGTRHFREMGVGVHDRPGPAVDQRVLPRALLEEPAITGFGLAHLRLRGLALGDVLDGEQDEWAGFGRGVGSGRALTRSVRFRSPSRISHSTLVTTSPRRTGSSSARRRGSFHPGRSPSDRPLGADGRSLEVAVEGLIGGAHRGSRRQQRATRSPSRREPRRNPGIG